jgi:hypothetical protein
VPYARPIANTCPTDWFWLPTWHKVLSEMLNFQAVGSLLNLTLMADDSSVLGPVITSLSWNNGSAWHVIGLTF